MIIILEMDIVQSAEEVGGKIGEPVTYVEGDASTHIKHICVAIVLYRVLLSLSVFLQVKVNPPLHSQLPTLHTAPCSLKMEMKVNIACMSCGL